MGSPAFKKALGKRGDGCIYGPRGAGLLTVSQEPTTYSAVGSDLILTGVSLSLIEAPRPSWGGPPAPGPAGNEPPFSRTERPFSRDRKCK